MSKLLRCVLLAACFATPLAVPAQSASADDTAIRSMMQKSADDWNQGDIDSFATCYKNSPDILFMGRTIRHGYADMVAGYKKSFATPEKMGKLTFTDLDIQPLDARFATATGWFHLKHALTDTADMDHGYFLLVLEKTSSGWKIIRDDTTDVPLTK